MTKPTPMQAYFSQTNIGQSSWWSWLCGFWFALVFFFYAQIIIGVFMMIAGMVVAPDTIANISASQGQSDLSLSKALFSLLIGVSPLLPVLFWVMRDNVKRPTTKAILISISALVMAITTWGFYYTLTSQDGDSAALTGQLISAHPLMYAFVLLSFPPLAIGFWLAQKFVHKRTILSLHTAAKKFRWKRLFFTMIVFWSVAVILSIITHVGGISPTEFTFDASKFFGYAIVTILFIPLQSATEEIALRGYLNQGIGRFIKNPWVVFVITSAAFAALHLGNPEITEGAGETPIIIAISGYFFFGMFACLLTWMDGGLESAIGMHAANNMFAAMIVGYENSALPTPTIFRTGQNSELDSIMVLVTLGLVFIVLHKTRKPFERAETEINVFN